MRTQIRARARGRRPRIPRFVPVGVRDSVVGGIRAVFTITNAVTTLVTTAVVTVISVVLGLLLRVPRITLAGIAVSLLYLAAAGCVLLNRRNHLPQRYPILALHDTNRSMVRDLELLQVHGRVLLARIPMSRFLLMPTDLNEEIARWHKAVLQRLGEGVGEFWLRQYKSEAPKMPWLVNEYPLRWQLDHKLQMLALVTEHLRKQGVTTGV